MTGKSLAASASNRFFRFALAISLIGNFVYDWRRYARHSFVYGRRSRENRRALIHILAHSIEHGMALPTPRRGYGKEKAASLLDKIKAYLADHGADRSVTMALKALDAYVAFQRKDGVDVEALSLELDQLEQRYGYRGDGCAGGVETLTAVAVKEAASFDFDRFMRMRHSVRQYTDQPVDLEVIRQAVANAQRSPSVCNRQTCRVYAITRPDEIRRVLAFQSGNAGFTHEVGVLFVITANIEHLNLIGERYQGWIDGGIFAMALALSLHAKGLGACCLNWSVTAERDRAMRRCVGIPDGELVITMMSAGHLKPEFSVPVSQRKPLEDVLVIDPALS